LFCIFFSIKRKKILQTKKKRKKGFQLEKKGSEKEKMPGRKISFTLEEKREIASLVERFDSRRACVEFARLHPDSPVLSAATAWRIHKKVKWDPLFKGVSRRCVPRPLKRKFSKLDEARIRELFYDAENNSKSDRVMAELINRTLGRTDVNQVDTYRVRQRLCIASSRVHDTKTKWARGPPPSSTSTDEDAEKEKNKGAVEETRAVAAEQLQVFSGEPTLHRVVFPTTLMAVLLKKKQQKKRSSLGPSPLK
jgi:hypothetical protein